MQNNKGYTVITGASAGIGRETAKAFAARGGDLILIARREDRLESLRQEITARFPRVDVVLQRADLACAEEVVQAYEQARAYPLRTWINNAGMGAIVPKNREQAAVYAACFFGWGGSGAQSTI